MEQDSQPLGVLGLLVTEIPPRGPSSRQQEPARYLDVKSILLGQGCLCRGEGCPLGREGTEQGHSHLGIKLQGSGLQLLSPEPQATLEVTERLTPSPTGLPFPGRLTTWWHPAWHCHLPPRMWGHLRPAHTGSRDIK